MSLWQSQTPYYIAGGSLPVDAPSYVVRQADTDLLYNLLDGNMCYVLDTRQVGKSSLMVRTATKLRARGAHVVILDISGGGQQLTLEQWYYGLLYSVGEQLDLEEEWEQFWEAHGALGPVHRFFACLRHLLVAHCSGHLILFLDEIDAVRGLPFSTDEFFAAIREVSNRHAYHHAQEATATRLVFCLLGVANPTDIISDPTMTPFNVGVRIPLQDFTLSEGNSLIRGLPGDARQIFERVIYWTHGHPYLTQKLCRALVERQAKTRGDVDRICADLFVNQTALREEDNLAFVHKRMLAAVESANELLLLYRRIRTSRYPVPMSDADLALRPLILCGIVRLESVRGQRAVTVRNRIYRAVFDSRWIRDAMPDAEARKHRRTWWLGFARASLLWTVLGLAVVIGIWQRSDAIYKAGKVKNLEVKNAEKDFDIKKKDTEIENKDIELHKLDKKLKTAKTSIQFNTEKNNHLVSQSERLEQRLQDSVGQLRLTEQSRVQAQQEAQKAGEQRDNAIAMALSVQKGQEANALQVSLKAVNVALSRGHMPDPKAQQALFHAVTAGAYRIKRIHYPENGTTRVAFAPGDFEESPYLVVSGGGRSLFLYDTRTWQKVQTVQVVPSDVKSEGSQGTITCAKFALKVPVLVTAHRENSDACFQIWDLSYKDGMLHHRSTLRCPNTSTSVAPCASLSADGSRLITNGSYNQARVWNLADGSFRTLSGHSGPVKGVDFASDQPKYEQIAMTFGDGASPNEIQSVRFWDTNTLQSLYSYGDGLQRPDRQVTAARFAHFVDLVFWGTHEGDLEAWTAPARPNMGHLFRRYHGATDQINDIDQTTNTAWLAATDNAGLTLIWYTPVYRTPLLALAPHAHASTCVRFSKSGQLLAIASQDGYVDIWSLPQRWYVGAESAVNYLDFSPDGNFLLAPNLGNVGKFWRCTGNHNDDLNAYKELPQGTTDLMHAVFSPDGTRVATSSRKGVVEIWKSPVDAHSTAKAYVPVTGHLPKTVFTVFFAPDGRSLVSAGADGILISDVVTGIELDRLTVENAISAVFQRDGHHLLVASQDGYARLYDLRTRRCTVTYAPQGKSPRGILTERYPWSAMFSPNEMRVLTADGDGNAYLWETRTGKLEGTFHVSTSAVLSAQFSPDGKRILTAGIDGITRIWDIPASPSKHVSEVISKRPFEVRTPNFELPGNGVQMNTARFTPDGKQFAVAGNDGLVRMYPATLDAMRSRAAQILATVPANQDE